MENPSLILDIQMRAGLERIKWERFVCAMHFYIQLTLPDKYLTMSPLYQVLHAHLKHLQPQIPKSGSQTPADAASWTVTRKPIKIDSTTTNIVLNHQIHIITCNMKPNQSEASPAPPCPWTAAGCGPQSVALVDDEVE